MCVGKKYNPEFDGTQIGAITDAIKNPNFTLSTDYWITHTKAKGIRAGQSGTFAHKDIAIRFVAWLSPEFELFLVDKIQELSILEKQKSESALLIR